MQVNELPGQIAQFFGFEMSQAVAKTVAAVVICLVAWLGFQILKIATGRLQRRFEAVSSDTDTISIEQKRAQTLTQLLNHAAAVALGIAATLTILDLFVDIGPLLAGVGVVGLAISFGAQSLVKDVFTGFFILMENQFGVGDIVRIEDKAGVVENMTLRVVTLRDLQGVLHIIPNGSITSVSNLTRSWARVVVDVGVAYREDVDRVLAVMREVAEKLWSDPEWHNRFVEQPLVLGVDQLADSGVVIRAWASTRPGKQFEVRREWLRRIKIRFDAEGIEIPFPHRTVYVRELPSS